jgi:hypothetical protein
MVSAQQNGVFSVQLKPQQIALVSQMVAQYIVSQRQRFLTRSEPLSAIQAAPMSGFFTPQLLSIARLLVLMGERVGNPDFYPQLRELGLANLPDFGQMAAVTFNEVITSHSPVNSSLLFHELVHVEQYRQTGIRHFAELYVRGFLSAGSYEAIPLELHACSLQNRFEQEPHRYYSVRDEVAAWMRRVPATEQQRT